MPLPIHAGLPHGLITIAIGHTDRIIIATDRTANSDLLVGAADAYRAVELQPGFVVACAGVLASSDHAIDMRRDVAAAFNVGDTAENFLQRFDQMHRRRLEQFLTDRFHTNAEDVLRECFSPLTPPQSMIVCEVLESGFGVTTFEYIPMLTSNGEVLVTPLLQARSAMSQVGFGAVGAAAPFIDLLETSYVEQALRGPQGPQFVARMLAQEALSRIESPNTTPVLHEFPIRTRGPRRRSVSKPQGLSPARPKADRRSPERFPPADTKDIVAVEQFVEDRFRSIFPDGRFKFLPRVFRDVAELFAGLDSRYLPVDLSYHDLEHTLQATVCLTSLLDGRHAARAAPRLDARHFELAIVSALLHDSGYLKLRSDTQGTGAKYTFCHVLRGCAFAAAYLPTIGADGRDVETVMAAINCTGPMNEIGRLRFQAPVDEVIGCALATADFLGQMAASDYPDELEVLFREFQESDDFLHTPAEHRVFKTAEELITRTPQFWRRFVLPKLESDFRGVLRYLAKPYPAGPNPYVEAVEANIAEVERRARKSAEKNFGDVLKPTKLSIGSREAPKAEEMAKPHPESSPSATP